MERKYMETKIKGSINVKIYFHLNLCVCIFLVFLLQLNCDFLFDENRTSPTKSSVKYLNYFILY